jgi:hypothetical protein
LHPSKHPDIFDSKPEHLKKITVAFVLLSQISCAQDFTGQISFIRRIIAKDNTVNVDSLMDGTLGDSSVYTLSGPYYKTTFFRKGKPTYTYTYHHAAHRFYHELPYNTYITYEDSRRKHDSLTSLTLHRDSITTILGYKCFVAHKVSENSTGKAWYSDQIRINPETFKGHNAADWYKELKLTNGCFNLKSVSEHGNYIEVFEAVRVIRKKIDEKFFQLPAVKPVVASYSTLDKEPGMKEISPQAQECYDLKAKTAPVAFHRSREVSCVVLFIVTADGKIQHVHPYEKDDYGLHKIAVDVVKNCGIEFTPGEIDGKPVSSEFYMIVGFNI